MFIVSGANKAEVIKVSRCGNFMHELHTYLKATATSQVCGSSYEGCVVQIVTDSFLCFRKSLKMIIHQLCIQQVWYSP